MGRVDLHLYIDRIQLSKSTTSATYNDYQYLTFCLSMMLVIEVSVFPKLAMSQKFSN